MNSNSQKFFFLKTLIRQQDKELWGHDTSTRNSKKITKDRVWSWVTLCVCTSAYQCAMLSVCSRYCELSVRRQPWQQSGINLVNVIMLLTEEYNVVKCLSPWTFQACCSSSTSTLVLVFPGRQLPRAAQPAVLPGKTAGWRLVWNNLGSPEQVLGKQMRQEFNFGSCLVLVCMEHVADIFRGAYELSQSMSLTLGESNISITLNVEPGWDSERSQQPGPWASGFHAPCVSVPGWRAFLEEAGETAAVPALLHSLWTVPFSSGRDEEQLSTFPNQAILPKSSCWPLVKYTASFL